MKNLLRKLCWPLLSLFEKGDEPYAYKPLNRKVLVVVGILFSALATGMAFLAPHDEDYGFLVPLIVFGAAGLVCLIVGGLGSDRAVAKIWGSR